MRIATLIPIDEVREIVENNLIFKAQPQNSEMVHLTAVWRMYVEPDIDTRCNKCVMRVLDNYRAIENDMIALVKDDNLLNNVN